MGISIRAYGRHRGVSEAAVRKAIKSGRITKESDGSIDPIKADHQWSGNTTTRGSQTPDVTLPQSGNTFMQARTANEVYKAKTNQVRFEQLKGQLVEKNKVTNLVFKLARQERDAWLNWPARIASQMAAELQVESHTMLVTLEQYVRQHLSELSELKLQL